MKTAHPKFLTFAAAFLSLGGLLFAGLAGCRGQGASGEQKIPLKEIYGNFGQDDLKPVREFLNKAVSEEAHQMSVKGGGASNIFLVRGDDINQAVLASTHVFTGGRSADVPGNTGSKDRSKKYWLVVYFGMASSGQPAWIINSTIQKNNTVELHYRKPVLLGGLEDHLGYFAWVPLGNLEDGTYTLKLVDDTKNQTMLTRTVNVKSANQRLGNGD